MSAWDEIQTLLTTVVIASLSWVSSALMPGSAPAREPAAVSDSPASFMVGWAQQVDQPPIEQVGEESGGDVETLDAGAPLAETAAASDQESLDSGTATTSIDNDVETLDQGAPVAAAGQPVETVSVAPVVTTATASQVEPELVEHTGPVIPEGFGTGQVQALAGRSEAPVGLADCHVGAVTGRAYVGIDCGDDEGTAFVGHARSFEEFPFVLEADFPFEGDEAFFTERNFPFDDDEEVAPARTSDADSDTGVFVSARGGERELRDDETSAPGIETAGAGSVQFAQRARDRDERVRVGDRPRGNNDRQRRSDAEARVSQQSSSSRGEDNREGKKETRNTTAESSEKDPKKAKKAKETREDRNGDGERDKKKRSRDRDD